MPQQYETPPKRAADAPDEITELRAELDHYATAYRKLIDLLEQKRAESDRHARAIEQKKVRGKDGQLIPHECGIAISGLAGGYLTAVTIAINLFEGVEARTAYLQRTVPQVPEMTGYEGNDPTGAPTLHRGLLERCPAPECEDRTLEQQKDRATPPYCTGDRCEDCTPDEECCEATCGCCPRVNAHDHCRLAPGSEDNSKYCDQHGEGWLFDRSEKAQRMYDVLKAV